jgi:hypothetical protein
MLTEGAPRGYTGPERDAAVAHIAQHLRTALTDLDAVAGS